MSEASPRRALLRHSPDVDLREHGAALSRDGIDCAPLDADISSDGEVLSALPVLYLFSPAWWRDQDDGRRAALLRRLDRLGSAAVLAGRRGEETPCGLDDRSVAGWLDEPFSPTALRAAVRGALRTVELHLELDETQRKLRQRSYELREEHRIGRALAAGHDLESTLHLILQIAREMTGADAGTVYLVEEDAEKRKALVFHVAQNASVPPPRQGLVLSLDSPTIAGHVARTAAVLRLDDVYELPPDLGLSFSTKHDQELGYRSRSMLVAPMCNHDGEVVGVLQLINRKRHFGTVLRDRATVEAEVQPFTDEDEDMLTSFAGEAAVAIENRRLMDSIQALFAGFVRASVTAIEARDPATFGHSERVAALTVALAQAISEVQVGRWRDVTFSPVQLKEIEYAGLLHDFGKVGVREQVLVKGKKLYDWQLDLLRSRFAHARTAIQYRYAEHKRQAALDAGRDGYAAHARRLDAACRAELDALDRFLAVVLQANEPSVLPEERFQELLSAAQTVALPDGLEVPLLSDDERRHLTIRRGTLDEEEYREIQSHVTHSRNFLVQIPWTRDLQHVPAIAYAHHEKLNGTGYPQGLRGDAIPIQAQMMTIADIFDALAAQDRPYKPAVPVPRSLDILRQEAAAGNVDADMLDLFIAREIYRVTEAALR